MQFTCHSLPVRQSMSVPWAFFTSSHFISQFPPMRFPLITAIGICHLLPVHHLEWHFVRVKGQNTTIGSYQGLPLWARVDFRAMAMKGYSPFLKAPALLKLTIRLFSVISTNSLRAILSLCRDAVSVSYLPSHVGYVELVERFREWSSALSYTSML